MIENNTSKTRSFSNIMLYFDPMKRRNLNLRTDRLDALVETARQTGIPASLPRLVEAAIEMAAAILPASWRLSDAAAAAGSDKGNLELVAEAVRFAEKIYAARAAGAWPEVYDGHTIQAMIVGKTEAAITARMEPILQALSDATGTTINVRPDFKTGALVVTILDGSGDGTERTIAFMDGATEPDESPEPPEPILH